jgi:3-deoxy-D-arabino-heptulosonate 7-phosphate (DAHP) synthase class II
MCEIQVSDKMDPKELVKLIEILNPQNKPGRITIIARMGAENMRVKLPHLIRAVRGAGQIVTWVSDPMHGNTIKAPCGLKTRPFDSILVLCSFFDCTLLSTCLPKYFIILVCLRWCPTLRSICSLIKHVDKWHLAKIQQ